MKDQSFANLVSIAIKQSTVLTPGTQLILHLFRHLMSGSDSHKPLVDSSQGVFTNAQVQPYSNGALPPPRLSSEKTSLCQKGSQERVSLLSTQLESF